MQSQCTYVLTLCFTTLELRLNKINGKTDRQNKTEKMTEKKKIIFIIIHLCK